METVAEAEAWVEIPVGCSHVVKVDRADVELVAGRKWVVAANAQCRYAVTMLDRRWKPMHRLLLSPRKGEVVDHINGDGLDNRRANLRICGHTQNLWNSRKHCKSSSIYKGVTWCKRNGGRWIAKLNANNMRVYGGAFKDEVEAAKCYDQLARKHFGEFAKTNF